jgi:hypothetical protein
MSIIGDGRNLYEIIADYLIVDNLVIIGRRLANLVFPDAMQYHSTELAHTGLPVRVQTSCKIPCHVLT